MPGPLHIVPAYIYTHQAYTIRKSNCREKLSHAGSRVPQVRILGPGIIQTHTATITPAPPTRYTASTAHPSSPDATARSSPAQSISGQTDHCEAAAGSPPSPHVWL